MVEQKRSDEIQELFDLISVQAKNATDLIKSSEESRTYIEEN